MRPKYDDELRGRALTLYSEGHGYKSIARQLGLSRDTVRNWVAVERNQVNKQSGTILHASVGNTRLLELRQSLKKLWQETMPEPEEHQKPAETYTEKQQRKHREKLARMEDKFKEARVAFENGPDSLLEISKKMGVPYKELLNYINTYHPESRLMHVYNRDRAAMERQLADQMNRLKTYGDGVLKQMSESFEREMAKIKRRV